MQTFEGPEERDPDAVPRDPVIFKGTHSGEPNACGNGPFGAMASRRPFDPRARRINMPTIACLTSGGAPGFRSGVYLKRIGFPIVGSSSNAGSLYTSRVPHMN